MVRRQGLFDDSSNEIDGMIFEVKQKLTELNSKCDSAQTFVDSKKSSFGKQNQTANHNGTVVNQLKTDLLVATKDFKTILELRSNKMKEQSKRKVELTGNASLSPIKHLAVTQEQQKNKKLSFGKNLMNPYANPTDSKRGIADRHGADIEAQGGGGDDNRRGGFSSSSSSHGNEMQQLLVVPPSAELQYYESREKAVSEVEQTIGELGTIFQRLAGMIAQQQELVERIDEDVESALTNANNTRDYLTDVYNSVSSNRGMYMKLGAIFLFFLILFTVFLM